MRLFWCILTPLLLVLALGISPSRAHKVVAAAYVEGPTVEGEVGFSNGDMVPDAKVEVFSSGGEKLLETLTDGDGYFIFEATRRIDHVIKVNLGAGHVAEVVVTADELPSTLAGAPTTSAASPTEQTRVASQQSQASLSSFSGRDIEAMVARAVAKEIRPLQKRIIAYENKVRWNDILGGLGYILGLTGIVFFFLARKKRRAE